MDDDRDDLTLPLILVGAGVGLLAAVTLYGNRRVRMALAEAGVEARRRDRELREEFDVPTLAEGLQHLRRLRTNLDTAPRSGPTNLGTAPRSGPTDTDEVAHAFPNVQEAGAQPIIQRTEPCTFDERGEIAPSGRFPT